MGEESDDAPIARFSSGDHVRLKRRLGSIPPNAHGVIVGFLRREPELIVVRLSSFEVVEVRPGDVEKL